MKSPIPTSDIQKKRCWIRLATASSPFFVIIMKIFLTLMDLFMGVAKFEFCEGRTVIDTLDTYRTSALTYVLPFQFFRMVAWWMSNVKEQAPVNIQCIFSDSGEEPEQIIRQSFLLFLQYCLDEEARSHVWHQQTTAYFWRYDMYLEISKPMDYRVGLYIRLSKEDDREGQSESVANQLSMLTEFASQQRLDVYDTYIDDGWSGTNFVEVR